MPYNILGIHPGHNSSAALISDGELIYYLEEERLSRDKRDGNPFRSIIDICSKYKIDELIIGGTNDPYEEVRLPWTGENPYTALVRKFHPKVKVIWLNHQHHLLHASCAFYNSGFDKAAVLVIDGAGSSQIHNIDNEEIKGFEAESIFSAKYPNEFKSIYKSYGKNDAHRAYLEDVYDFDNAITITKSYEAVTLFLGWPSIEGGKTMGLAPYGKNNPNIPSLFKNGRGNRDFFIPIYPKGATIDLKNLSILKRDREPDLF